MKRHAASSELPFPKPPERGISRAKAHLLAEGSHWLATGEVFHDESEPMGRILARMDQVVPLGEHFDLLISSHERLGGHRPMDYINAGELAPLEALLDQMEVQEESVTGSGNGVSPRQAA